MTMPPGKLRSANHHGFSAVGVILLLGLVVLFVVLGRMRNQQKQEAERTFQLQLTDPKVMLERFFQERGRTREFKRGDWKILLEFMSQDDRQWLDENRALLASFGDRLPGIAARAATDAEQQFAALEVLLKFGPDAPRPIVMNAESKAPYGVAFYHNPGDIHSLQPAFLVEEGGSWRIRRFLGRRDYNPLRSRVVDERAGAGLSLSAEDQEFLKDRMGWETKKRNEMLAQVGIGPQGTAASAMPNATPPPATLSGSAPLTPGSLRRQTPVPVATPVDAAATAEAAQPAGTTAHPDPTPLIPAGK